MTLTGKELAQKKFTTNDFGSFNGEFSIPKQTLSGVFRLSTGQMSVYIPCRGIQTPDFSKRTSSRSRAISLSAIPLPYKARRLHFPACRYPAEMSLGVLHAGPSCCGGISVRALRHKLRKGVPPFPAMEHSTYLSVPKKRRIRIHTLPHTRPTRYRLP